MTVRNRMTMRAVVERPAETPDTWEGPPDWIEVATVPCRTWTRQRRVPTGDGTHAVIEDLRAAVPIGASVEVGDQLTVKDRLGDTLFSGPLAVESIGRHGNHLSLMLRRHA